MILPITLCILFFEWLFRARFRENATPRSLKSEVAQAVFSNLFLTYVYYAPPAAMPSSRASSDSLRPKYLSQSEVLLARR